MCETLGVEASINVDELDSIHRMAMLESCKKITIEENLE